MKTGTETLIKTNPTYSEAFQAGVREEMTLNPDIFILGTDLGERGGHFAQVKGIAQEFGVERVRDTPISEAAMVAAGVGAAMYGLHPIVDLNFIDFALGAMDEIINQAAKVRFMFGRGVPLVIRATSGVALAGAHHSNSFESFFAHTPGLSLAVPSSPRDVKGLIKTALRVDDPVIFLMHKKLTGVRGPIGEENELIPFGKANVLRTGKDAALITYGYTVITAAKAAHNLALEGIDVEIIDLRTLYPIDRDAINDAVRKFGRVVVADEAPRYASITAEIAATATEDCFADLKGPIVRVGAVRAPISANPTMSDAAIPSVSSLVEAVRKVMSY
jgi:pyruvate/2-oxoglutarate/acetoin dehydrogenase E1 component